MGSPSMPDPVTPAARPERKIDVEPEQIQLGGTDKLSADSSVVGKKALTRPRGSSVQASSATSGLKV